MRVTRSQLLVRPTPLLEVRPGLYFLGLGTHNGHLAETGRLGAEAVVDASLVAAALKLATNRERPNEGNGQGGFWPHGTRSYELDGSFPSGHAAQGSRWRE